MFGSRRYQRRAVRQQAKRNARARLDARTHTRDPFSPILNDAPNKNSGYVGTSIRVMLSRVRREKAEIQAEVDAIRAEAEAISRKLALHEKMLRRVSRAEAKLLQSIQNARALYGLRRSS